MSARSVMRGDMVSDQSTMPFDGFASFYEELGRKYPEEKLTYLTLGAQLRKRWILDQLRRLKGILLDAGCHKGLFCNRYRNGSVIGVDISPSLIATAKHRFPKVRFYVGDIRSMPFIENEFVDAVLCAETLEHIPDPEAALNEFMRVLKPKGSLLLLVPDFAGTNRPAWVIKQEMTAYGIEALPYFHTAYSPQELADLVSAIGFNVVYAGAGGHEAVYIRKRFVKIFNLAALFSRRFTTTIIGRRIAFLLDLLFFSGLLCCGLRAMARRKAEHGYFSFVVAEKPLGVISSDEERPVP
ncbi:MAG: class I SAM-dependent methyltransferase [Planctomycetota bacterium]